MSKYGDKTKDDLYDELVYLYEQSYLSITDWIALVLELLSDIVSESFELWKKGK